MTTLDDYARKYQEAARDADTARVILSRRAHAEAIGKAHALAAAFARVAGISTDDAARQLRDAKVQP